MGDSFHPETYPQGHGRATMDSHEDTVLVVSASLKELGACEFVVFKNSMICRLAMTAYILYTALDDKLCAQPSRRFCVIFVYPRAYRLQRHYHHERRPPA